MIGSINDKNLNSEIETTLDADMILKLYRAINDKNLNSEIETHFKVQLHHGMGLLSMIRISILRLKQPTGSQLCFGQGPYQ